MQSSHGYINPKPRKNEILGSTRREELVGEELFYQLGMDQNQRDEHDY